MYDLEQAINDRRWTRMFLPDKPVPRELVDQGPRTGDPGAVATSKPPVVPELFAHLRRDLGAKVYGSWASPATTPRAGGSPCCTTPN